MFDFALSIGGAMLFSLFIVYDTKVRERKKSIKTIIYNSFQVWKAQKEILH